MEVKIKTPEYLSDDIFDEHFLQTFFFQHRMQYLMGSGRMDIKNRFAMPTTIGQRCYTILCILLTTVSDFALYYINIREIKHPILHNLSITSLLILFTAFVLNMIHYRFINRDKNVEFLVKMQKLDRLLNIDKWEVFSEWIKTISNGPIALATVAFLIVIVLGFIEQGFLSLMFIGTMYSAVVILMDTIACSTIISFFVLRMRFINCLMENHLEREKSANPAKSFLSRSYIRYYTQKTQNYYETSDVHIYLGEIFKCFTMYQDLYKFQVIKWYQ